MIRGGFLSSEDRTSLSRLARDGSAAHRFARRANALLLLDKGWSCVEVAEALLLDDETVRDWFKLYEESGVGGLTRFEVGGSVSQLSQAQEEALVAWISQALPRSTRQVGAFIESRFSVVYDSRSGLVALLHRLGLEFKKPEAIGRRLDAAKQQAFIAAYEKLLNSLGPDEALVFADAVHPTHATRPVGCWAKAGENLALEQTTGRQRLNIHGALDLETGRTAMIDVESVDAASTIRLLQAIEAMYPLMAMIHVFLDNARYHHAVLVQEWLAQPGRRITLHFMCRTRISGH
jgi:transposase